MDDVNVDIEELILPSDSPEQEVVASAAMRQGLRGFLDPDSVSAVAGEVDRAVRDATNSA